MISPRGIRCSSMSGRLLAVSCSRLSASKTAHRDVKAMSVAKSSIDSPKSCTIWRFKREPPSHQAPLDAPGILARVVGDDQQQSEEDHVGEDRATAVGDEGKGHARKRD